MAIEFKFNNLILGPKFLLFFLISICILLFASINLILFLLMTSKVKILYVIYKIIEISLAFYLNNKLVYIGFLVLFFFQLCQNLLKILFVEKIYISSKYRYYCKMFKIKNFNKIRQNSLKEELITKDVEISMIKKKKKSINNQKATI